MTDLRQLRQKQRALRRTLTDAERQQASSLICEKVKQLSSFQKAQHIAAYLAFDGEPDLEVLLQQATALGKALYLPILVAKQKPMLFAPFCPGDTLKPNWFGIPEPVVAESEMIRPCQLDLVLTPLVAFDEQCNRLGVGGGFYDRSFAFVNENPSVDRPLLLGLAFELQKVASLPRRSWDVVLDGVVTEADIYSAEQNIVWE